MITVIEGRIGAGKSFNATSAWALPQFLRGGVVCTNVPLKWDKIKAYCLKRFGVELQDAQFRPLEDSEIQMFHTVVPMGCHDLPVLVIIDEAQLFFNAKDHGEDWKRSKELFKWLTHSRHYHVDVVFISQSIINMNAQFARLAQYIYRYRDLSKWRVPGLGIKLPFCGNKILEAWFDYDGKTMLGRRFLSKDVRIFELYDSFAQVKNMPTLDQIQTKFELKKIERKPIWQSGLFPSQSSLALSCLAGLLLFFATWENPRHLRKSQAQAVLLRRPVQSVEMTGLLSGVDIR